MKFEMMMKTMENLMDRITMENKPDKTEPNDPHIRNPNFKGPNPPPPPHIRKRDVRNHRNQNSQQIQPPFP